MHTHDSNLRPSVREHFTDNHATGTTLPDTTVSTQNHPTPTSPIDWALIHALIPWFAAVSAWLMWAGFLLIPTLFGLHYAGMFPAANNAVYVLMGLVFAMTATIAAQLQHGVHAIAFTFGTLLLAYWF